MWRWSEAGKVRRGRQQEVATKSAEVRDGQVAPFPKLRRVLAAMYPAVQRVHKIHGLIEVDVTDARRMVRDAGAASGEPISFTAFITMCVARAVCENPSLNACRMGGKRLFLFNDVDVATAVERDLEAHKQPIIYIILGANRKNIVELSRELRAAQRAPVENAWKGFGAERWLRRAPMPLIRGAWAIFWRLRSRSPRVQRRYGGTVGLTAVGMFGRGGGWAIPLDYHTLNVAVGGLAEKPGVVDGRIAIREYLCITLGFDHDIIDGAPAARFVARLRELIEEGFGLREEESVVAAATAASDRLRRPR